MLLVIVLDGIKFARRTTECRQGIEDGALRAEARKTYRAAVRRPNGTAIIGVDRELKSFLAADKGGVDPRPLAPAVVKEAEGHLVAIW